MSNKETPSSWNLNAEEDTVVPNFRKSTLSSSSVHPVYPLKNFSSFGGGDAPVMADIPRVRNHLFTVSTRSIISSHSQLNACYTIAPNDEESNLGNLTENTKARNFNHLNVEGSLNDENNEKLINTHQIPLEKAKVLNEDPYAFDSNEAMKRLQNASHDPDSVFYEISSNLKTTSLFTNRCIHGSLENLHGGEFARGGNVKVGNRRRSAPGAISHPTNYRCKLMEAANDLLCKENKSLSTKIQKTKKKLFITKIATCFALEALKRRGRIIKELEASIIRKNEQCAARLILHSLLLNCWRNTRRELDLKLDDNNELRKSVENFTLQVQVLRHVSNNERQKVQEKSKLIESLNEEVCILKEENRMMKREVDKMENELNSLQASTQNLDDENKALTKEIKLIVEQRDRLNQSYERERRKSEEFGNDNRTMKERLNKVENQMKEATEQKAHWQERAMTSESEAWELQLNLEQRNKNIKELKTTCDSLRQEKMDLIERKAQLKAHLDKTLQNLQSLSQKNNELTKTYDSTKTERDSKARKIEELEKMLEMTRKEYFEVERELLTFKLQNVRRRRDLGNALYFFVSPVEAVRRKISY